MHYVYLITNSINGKVYVGMTGQSIVQRFSEHRNRAKHKDTAISRAIFKYGQAAFSILQLAETTSADEAGQWEKHFIEQYRATSSRYGYNAAPGGVKTQSGLKRSDATRQRIREARLGRGHSPETRRRMSIERKARGIPAELQAKMQTGCAKPSARLAMGWRRDMPLSTELKQKISATKQGIPPHQAIEAWSELQASRMAIECGSDHRKGKNLYIDPNGRRHCRACNTRAQARRALRGRIAA
jgi:group I intron endonuclease